jgi:glycerol-3-phosphate acyltransferase PlsY
VRTAAAILGAYLAGGVNGGYYIVRAMRDVDLRQTGSGSTGGTNAARVLGKWARPTVGGLDLLKGAAILCAARSAGLGTDAQGEVLFAAVLGNIYPFQLGFRGGKGIGTSLGALCVYSPRSSALIALVTAAGYRLTGRQQVSGVAGYALVGLLAPRLAATRPSALALLATTALVIHANRANFFEDLSGDRVSTGGRAASS